MFGIFRPKLDRAADAVVAFLREKFVGSGTLPAAALSDYYCLGFLRMVGVHVASPSLPKGSGMDEAKAVFEIALMRLAPDCAREAAEVLPFLSKDEAFLRGTKDGDLYMGWALLHIAPERDGQAALQRFSDRLRQVTSPTKAPSAIDYPSPSTDGGNGTGPRAQVRWTDWQAEDKSEGFDGPAKQDIRRTYTFFGMNSLESAATLTIVCALESTATPDGQSASLDRKLRFYLSPFRLPHEAEFVMRLATRDEAQGGEFDVVASPAEPGGDIAIIAKYGGRNDVASCVATLRSGRDMVFMLRDQREALVNFLLPNDGAFQQLYDETLGHLQKRAVMNQVLSYNAELQRGQRDRSESQTLERMQGNAWKIVGSGHEYTLSRTYSSSGGSATTLEIICTVKSSPEANFVVSDLRLRFKPLRLEQEGSLVLGLITDEPKGALVEVEAIPVPGESRNTMLDVVMLVHREDAHKLLRALASGHDLHYVLMNPAPPEEKPFLTNPLEYLARLVLANDDAFKSLYEETVEKVSVCQDATRARQLSEGWYRRRMPGRDAG
jgi:hypothetical protein